ncbi:MAG: alpha/beta fold hydrolase, partial [Burkholderiaceae bacterium]|nr:alpha/beta fold hydrolase [Burkholderiaceae bacterium]
MSSHLSSDHAVPIEQVAIGPQGLAGELALPQARTGVVVFAHGSGSSRHSPRNALVAQVMQSHGLATLMFDLLTEIEARDRRNVFDVDLLSMRVAGALDWLQRRADVAGLPVGLFGASTGAAAALQAAAQWPQRVQAVVSRGGRPDLAGAHLAQVRAPTLLIVGGNDNDVLELNQAAARALVCDKHIEIV